MSSRHCPRLQRHLDTKPGVETSAAHLGQLPARAKITRAPFGVGLKAAAGENDGLCRNIADAVRSPGTHAVHAQAVEQKLRRAGPVTDIDAALARRRSFTGDQFSAAAPSVERDLSSEPEPSVFLDS